VRGNAVGTTQTTAAYKTANWWVHKGATGSTYVDGTTSDYDKLAIAFGAATATVEATTAVISMPDIHARTESLAAYTGITHTDGILTFAGQSRTFTVTMKPATATNTVKSGYSIKVSTTTTDVAGNATQSVAYYAATSAVGGATASWTTTCPADDSAATFTYATAIEHRITMGALLDTDGLPTGVTTNPLASKTYSMGLAAGQVAGTVGLTCQDTTRIYNGGGSAATQSNETLAVSSNNYAIATAGSLASVTATAYDQYGAGVAGAIVGFRRVTTNATAAGTTTNVNLTTSANGTATISEVHCKTGGEIKSTWSVVDAGTSVLHMDNVAAADPNAGAVEGTNIYCTTAGLDSDAPDATPLEQVADTLATVVFTFPHAISGIDTATSTYISITYNGGTAVTVPGTGTAGGFTHTVMQTKIRTLVGVAALTPCVLTSAAVVTCSAVAGLGAFGTFAVTNTNLADGNAASLPVITQGGASTSILGISPITFTFIDDDPTANKLITEHTLKTTITATGESLTTTKYNTWLYDSTDMFSLNAADDDVATTVTAASEAQFEAANALHNDLLTHMTMNYRTGVLTSGISLITVGT
jgi:hypothetical protein